MGVQVKDVYCLCYINSLRMLISPGMWPLLDILGNTLSAQRLLNHRIKLEKKTLGQIKKTEKKLFLCNLCMSCHIHHV